MTYSSSSFRIYVFSFLYILKLNIFNKIKSHISSIFLFSTFLFVDFLHVDIWIFGNVHFRHFILSTFCSVDIVFDRHFAFRHFFVDVFPSTFFFRHFATLPLLQLLWHMVNKEWE